MKRCLLWTMTQRTGSRLLLLVLAGLFMCVYVYVCMCAREKVFVRESECVHVCERVCLRVCSSSFGVAVIILLSWQLLNDMRVCVLQCVL